MPVPSTNAYRQILARKFPEPFIALLAFVLGVWLWDHYFGKNEGYPPGTDQIAMVKLDRDFRLAESMAGDPAWLRNAVGVETPQAVRLTGIVSLKMLHEEKSLGDRASEAMVVAIAEDRGLPLLDTLRQVSGGEDGLDLPIPYEVLVERLATGQGTWWDRSMLRAYQQERPTGPEFAAALKVYDDGTAVLRKRAIVARSVVWSVVLLGSLMIPLALKRLIAKGEPSEVCYSNRWTAPLGLVVFLVAVLAWIGFEMTLRAGLLAVAAIPPWLGIALDSALRLLPAMIAIGLLFRRPSHAVRVLGLVRRPSWVLVFGMFSLLSWLSQGTTLLFGGMSPPDPAGGLSSGEAGFEGLAFAVISACLMAPIAEEIVYRGVLFRSLSNRFGVLAAAVLSSGAFALVHFYNITGLVGVALFGFVCALVYSKTRALSSVIALHCLYNLAVKLPEWLVYHAPLQ
ncbi:MAG: hypothetical protein CFE26_09695 [Verrucomicrobiales bacterium VVV1]|nr:MAG: hypothetical protein CFE26_09695 [Verrucomicrobiales bacterium VVV1]